MSITPDSLPQLRFEILEAARILRMSRGTLYARIRVGAIAAQKDGRRRYITAIELNRYIASLTPLLPLRQVETRSTEEEFEQRQREARLLRWALNDKTARKYAGSSDALARLTPLSLRFQGNEEFLSRLRHVLVNTPPETGGGMA